MCLCGCTPCEGTYAQVTSREGGVAVVVGDLLRGGGVVVGGGGGGGVA